MCLESQTDPVRVLFGLFLVFDTANGLMLYLSAYHSA
jgi:hypothetical protein